MADLIDTGAAWPAGIYQIETTDPVLGGAPNIATGAGMSNIPHLQLAQRSQVLKDIIDASGLGAASVPLVVLNSAEARLTGSYRFASADANTPATGVAGTVQVIAASASAVNQTACDSASTRMWTRFWNGTVWSAWAEIWRMTGATASLAANGWQKLPSGLILQWGSGSGTTGALAASGAAEVFVTVTFPVAFPTVCLAVMASPADVLGAAFQEQANAHTLSTVNFSLNLQCRAAGAAMSARYLAIGY